jgi:phosphinothricin acetyltransferase
MYYQENEFFFRIVSESDLPEILEIYNQSILTGKITADTEIVDMDYMKNWLKKHDEVQWPAWVMNNAENEILGFCSLNCFYPRPAYNITSEISIYLRIDQTGKNRGEKMLCYLEEEAQKRDIKNLLAFVFDSNEPAMRFFTKFGYKIQGRFPNLALMNNKTHRNLVIFRKTLFS